MSSSEQTVRAVDNRSDKENQIIKRTTAEINDMQNIKKNTLIYNPDIVPQPIGTNMLPTNLSTVTATDINNTNTEINKLKAALLNIGWGY